MQKVKNYQSVLKCSLKSSLQTSYKSKMIRGGYMDFYTDLVKKDIDDEIDPLRTFSKTPYKVLNAPKLKDDFYTTQLDWGKNGLISVVLDNAVYVW